MTRRTECKWCAQGHTPRDDGKHWIVQSIIPAKISLYECKNARFVPQTEDEAAEAMDNGRNTGGGKMRR